MKNILIVDDDPVISSLLKSFLALKKYNVECVTTGIDALNALVRGSFDVVITDMKMHGMGGGELIKKMIRIQSSIKLIAMSGDTSFDKLSPDLKETIPLLRKPFRLQEVEKLILKLSSNDNEG